MFDGTSWWVFFQKHKQFLNQALLGLLLFTAGWQAGRVMSPYYSSQPIIFEDRQCAACSGSGGTVSELQALKDEGIASRRPAASPAVAAAASTAQGEFVASINSDLYHHSSCPAAKRINPENQVWFTTNAEAEAAGYSPSQCAKEKLGL